MDVRTAHNVIKQLNLSKGQERELAAMLLGKPVVPKRQRVITVAAAKADFKNRLKKMVG